MGRGGVLIVGLLALGCGRAKGLAEPRPDADPTDAVDVPPADADAHADAAGVDVAGSDSVGTDAEVSTCEMALHNPSGALCLCNANCASGFCVTGRCCNTVCNGPCQSCNNTTGICVAVAARTACEPSPGTCAAPGSTYQCDMQARCVPGGGTDAASAEGCD